MSARIVCIHTPVLFDAAVEEAVDQLRRGEVVAVPTETVYGLAANALDPRAVARIFRVKGRPAHNPVIVHVASHAMVLECAAEWPPLAESLARAFWPGPLTLVLPRRPSVPDIVTAGGNTVAIRWPQHPFMQAIILRCGFPLAAPSANLSNRLSPTTAQHVARQLGDRIPLIVDGGDCNVGIESTVVDVTGRVPCVLRPGMISSVALFAASGMDSIPAESVGATGNSSGLHRSPGMLAKHYSPRARLLILSWSDETELEQQLLKHGVRLDHNIQILAHNHIPMSGRFAHVNVIPHDAEAFARGLYGELHRCDDAGADWIVVEALPNTPEWYGISDRLTRAAARE